ncbi:MAG: MoxR family ATPase [Myxococcales bacterium]|nr:MoxR family ATPase [Myxococcales bacterium]
MNDAPLSIEEAVKEDRASLTAFRASVSSAFRGKEAAVDLALTALLGRGHVLFEDVPGTGKTTLARAMAASLDARFRRIQFTSDLLPSDVLGISVFQQDRSSFEFRPGPIFANVVLADEVNRTTPRTQSALLEAMSEGRVTVDDTTHALPSPFIVIATQNPKEFYGTYPLPESQLDRFMLRLAIGYPDKAVERVLIQSYGWTDPVSELRPVATAADVLRWQSRVEKVRVEPVLMEYVMAVVGATRASPHLSLGVSTRGAISFYRAVQARAYLLGRAFATPDDVQALVVPSMSHRVYVKAHRDGSSAQREEAAAILTDLIESLPVPR